MNDTKIFEIIFISKIQTHQQHSLNSFSTFQVRGWPFLSSSVSNCFQLEEGREPIESKREQEEAREAGRGGGERRGLLVVEEKQGTWAVSPTAALINPLGFPTTHHCGGVSPILRYPTLLPHPFTPRLIHLLALSLSGVSQYPFV